MIWKNLKKRLLGRNVRYQRRKRKIPEENQENVPLELKEKKSENIHYLVGFLMLPKYLKKFTHFVACEFHSFFFLCKFN